MGKHGKALVHSANGSHLVVATKEEKLLPASVVKESVEEKVEAMELNENRKLTKKEKDALKDEVITTLLPRAFSKKSTISALIIPEQQLILVNSSSNAKAEELLALLRKAIGSLPVIPVSFITPVEQTLTQWVLSETAPAPFEIQHEAEFKSVADEGGTARFKDQELSEDEVLAHLNSGKQVHSLAFHFGHSAAFTLGSDCTIKKLRFSEEFRAGNDDMGNEDPSARLDADFVLMAEELKALTSKLFDALGGLESVE